MRLIFNIFRFENFDSRVPCLVDVVCSISCTRHVTTECQKKNKILLSYLYYLLQHVPMVEWLLVKKIIVQFLHRLARPMSSHSVIPHFENILDPPHLYSIYERNFSSCPFFPILVLVRPHPIC